MQTFYEFFAGGGMARAGLGAGWTCAFANEIDEKKAASYEANWGKGALLVKDVAKLTLSDLPAQADLAWASFPCQDLSLAGSGAGLKGDRSGMFWPFWRLMEGLRRENRAPKVIVLENVCGALTSHEGKDFASICKALFDQDYRFGAVVMDAIDFLPQSRPRLFIIGVQEGLAVPDNLVLQSSSTLWHTKALIEAHRKLPASLASEWIWWTMPEAKKGRAVLSDIIQSEPAGVSWHTAAETKKLLGMMNALNIGKVQAAKAAKRPLVGAIYRRTRPNEKGVKVQRAEVRFDDVSGCLRTPTGGSSRQLIMIVDGNDVRTRLISPRETARLMGLKDTYVLPKSYNEAYHLTGDGLAVPVVRHLAKHIVESILAAGLINRQAGARVSKKREASLA